MDFTRRESYDQDKDSDYNASSIEHLRVYQNLITPGVSYREEKALGNIRDYIKEKTDKECTLPQHVIEDVYSMYYNDEVKRRPRNKKNLIKNKVLDGVYNSLTKIVTKDAPLFTQMMTREIALYLQEVHDKMEEEQEKNGTGEEGVSPFDCGDGDGEGKSQSKGDGEEGDEESESLSNGIDAGDSHKSGGLGDVDDVSIDNLLKESKNKLEKAMDKAEKEYKDLEDSLGKKAMSELSSKDLEFFKSIDKIKHKLKDVTISKEAIKKVLVKILNESQNYFSKKFTTVEESLFDSDDLDDLFGLEYLNPMFKNLALFSAGNVGKIYRGKMDLYLDCSGSMESRRMFEGSSIRMIDLVKGIAIILFRMDMIDKLYFFDNALYEIENINEFTILGFDESGGTNFNRVIAQVQHNQKNSVIITDGQDNCGKYSSQAFWIGVGGTKFNNSDAFRKYKESKQCVTYNSRNGGFDYITS